MTYCTYVCELNRILWRCANLIASIMEKRKLYLGTVTKLYNIKCRTCLNK